MEEEMNLTNLDIFAGQFVEEYKKLSVQYPWMTKKLLTIKAKESTIEYLYLQLKSELKFRPVWPRGFKIE